MPDASALRQELYEESQAAGKPLTGKNLDDAVKAKIRSVSDFSKVVTTVAAVLLKRNPDMAYDVSSGALDNNFSPSAMAAGSMPVLAEGISLVAAGTALAAGTVVVGTVSIGGLIYYLVQASAVNPAVYKVLVDDGESDYDKIMAMEAARKLRAEQQAMLAATSATATTTTADFLGQPRGPSIFSTPPPPLFDPRLVTPIAMTGATFLTTPVATIPIWQESIPIWTVPPVQLVTPIPDVPSMMFLLNSVVLLPGEGMVDTYGNLAKNRTRGSNLASHHLPNDQYMRTKGVARNEGISMRVEEPRPGVGGRHREIHKELKTQDPDLEPRDALAESVWRARTVYSEEGLGSEIRPSLQKVIEKNKEMYPDLFKKKK